MKVTKYKTQQFKGCWTGEPEESQSSEESKSQRAEAQVWRHLKVEFPLNQGKPVIF